MTWSEQIKGWLAAFGQPADYSTEQALRAAGVAVDDDVTDAPAPPDVAKFAAEREAALSDAAAATAAAEAALAEERRARIAGEAEAFASGQVPSRLVPAARPALLALFAQLAEDDSNAAAVVTFGEGEGNSGGRVDALKALIESLPDLHLTEEQLRAVADGRVEFKENRTTQDGKGVSAARRRELMGLTPLGSACLEEGK